MQNKKKCLRELKIESRNRSQSSPQETGGETERSIMKMKIFEGCKLRLLFRKRQEEMGFNEKVQKSRFREYDGESSVVGRRKYNCIVNLLSAGSVIISHNDDIIHCSK